MPSDPNSQAVMDNPQAQLLFEPFELFIGTGQYQPNRGKEQSRFVGQASSSRADEPAVG
jgi:hypothetical protein